MTSDGVYTKKKNQYAPPARPRRRACYPNLAASHGRTPPHTYAAPLPPR